MRSIYNKIVRDEEKLRVKSSLVLESDDIDYMLKELYEACDFYEDDGYAVAGIQLGIDKRIFVTQNLNEDRKVYINPKIIKTQEPFIFDGETCLSYPEKKPLDTKRFKKVSIEYQDREFKEYKEENINTIKAIVLQHEIDHLDGILYFDRTQKPILVNKIGRNEPCLCGSGKKFKKCCMKK